MIRRIEREVCIGCGICAVICPGDVIALDASDKATIRHGADCWTCFSCELACPVQACDVHPYRKPKPMAW